MCGIGKLFSMIIALSIWKQFEISVESLSKIEELLRTWTKAGSILFNGIITLSR